MTEIKKPLIVDENDGETLKQNKAKLLLISMTKKIFHMTMLIMKKMRMKHFHMTKKMTKLNRSENHMFCMS